MTKAAVTSDLANNDQYFDNGNSASFSLTNGGYQRYAPNSGATPTITISGWPDGTRVGELMIKGINLGAATITWPAAVRWIRFDGSLSTSFPSGDVQLQTSGVDFIMMWSDDAGTTVYAKVLR